MNESPDLGKSHNYLHSTTCILGWTLPVIDYTYDPTQINILSGGQFSYIVNSFLSVCSAYFVGVLRISNELIYLKLLKKHSSKMWGHYKIVSLKKPQGSIFYKMLKVVCDILYIREMSWRGEDWDAQPPKGRTTYNLYQESKCWKTHTYSEEVTYVCSSEGFPKSPVQVNSMTTIFLTLVNGSDQHNCTYLEITC